MHVRDHKGFTLIELLIVVAIIGTIAAVAVPGLLRARMAGNEMSAVASMRGINSAQNAYNAGCGNGFFAPDLVELGKVPVGGGIPFISPDLGGAVSVVKAGYTVALGPGSGATTGTTAACTGTAGNTLVSTYLATAAPLSGTTGVHYFATSEAQTIFQHSATITAISNAGVPTPAAAKPIQ